MHYKTETVFSIIAELADILHFSKRADDNQRLTLICTVITIAAEFSLLMVCCSQQDFIRLESQCILHLQSCNYITSPVASSCNNIM